MARKKKSNILAIGGLNSGKTESLIKPNILELDSSYIISDPGEDLLSTMGPALLTAGYQVKTFSLKKPEYSHHYNPLDYIYDVNGEYEEEKGGLIAKAYADNIHQSKKEDGAWLDIMTTIILANIEYIVEFRNKEERNFITALKILKKWAEKGSVPEIINHIKLKNKVARCLKTLERIPCDKQSTFLSALNEIISTLDNLLSKREVSDILTSVQESDEYDVATVCNIEIDKIGCGRTALFIDTNVSTPYYKWINAVLFAQCYDILIDSGEKYFKKWYLTYNEMPISSMFDSEEEAENYRSQYKNAFVDKEEDAVCIRNEAGFIDYVRSQDAGNRVIDEYRNAEIMQNDSRKLPISVRIILKDLDHIGTIPQLGCNLSATRYYGISTIFTARSVNQMHELYGEDTDLIAKNCKYVMYFGHTDPETCQFVTSIIKNGRLAQTNFICPNDIPDIMNIIVDRRSDPCSVRYEQKYDLTRHSNYHLCEPFQKAVAHGGNVNAS